MKPAAYPSTRIHFKFNNEASGMVKLSIELPDKIQDAQLNLNFR